MRKEQKRKKRVMQFREGERRQEKVDGDLSRREREKVEGGMMEKGA